MDAALKSEVEIFALWEAYAAVRDRRLRDELIEKYLPLARRIAGRLYRMRWEDSGSFDDYLQYARLGLVEAVERFDPRRRTSFEAFSSHRIRGAVLNGLAKESETAAQRYQRRQAAMVERTASLGARAIEHPQRASLEDIAQLTVELALGLFLESEEEEPVDESVPANPYAVTELHQVRTLVQSLLDKLPEKEREVLKSHYYEQVEFQAIADRMKLTKGRISQLHARALSRIRELIENRPRIDRKL